MEIKGNTVTFLSGRTRSANRGIIGLSPDLTVSEGYDGGFQIEPCEWDEPDEDDLTKEDRIELADYMIAQWQKFKDKQTDVEGGAVAPVRTER
jgi:hypothetical protein